MAVAELRQQFCHLFRRGNADICDQAAMQGFWVIKIDDTLGEIGAVIREKVKMRTVRG